MVYKQNFYNGENFELASRKGVFYYDYITDLGKYDEGTLPSRETFYNKMNDKHILVEDYKHALNVFSKFRCESLGQYSYHYMKINVLLLANVFENFWNIYHRMNKIDPF